MIFSASIDLVNKLCPESRMTITPEQHKVLLDEVLPLLVIDSEPLLGAAKAILGDDIFATSAVGIEYSSQAPDKSGVFHLPIAIGSVYLRTEKNNSPLSLKVTVLRGYTSRFRGYPAHVVIELDVCDIRARLAFEAMYKDYRAQLCRLLEHARIEFFTSYCSDIVGKSKSKRPSVLLDEYFSDPQVDNHFTLSVPCRREVEHAVAIRAFLVMSIIYASCHAALRGKNWRSTFEKNLLRLVK
jgi:hypothetical protein